MVMSEVRSLNVCGRSTILTLFREQVKCKKLDVLNNAEKQRNNPNKREATRNSEAKKRSSELSESVKLHFRNSSQKSQLELHTALHTNVIVRYDPKLTQTTVWRVLFKIDFVLESLFTSWAATLASKTSCGKPYVKTVF